MSVTEISRDTRIFEIRKQKDAKVMDKKPPARRRGGYNWFGVAKITVANSAERELQTQFAFCITKPNLATQQMVRSKKQALLSLFLVGWGGKI